MIVFKHFYTRCCVSLLLIAALLFSPCLAATAFAADASGDIAAASPFADVSADSPYYDAICFAAEIGVMSGRSSTVFAPDDILTRAEMAQMLYNAANSPAADDSQADRFADVGSGAWYAQAVAWAAANGIIRGVSAGRFAPNGILTQAQAATMLARFAQTYYPLDGIYAALDSLEDGVAWAAAMGVHVGGASDGVTRAEAAQMIADLYGAVAASDGYALVSLAVYGNGAVDTGGRTYGTGVYAAVLVPAGADDVLTMSASDEAFLSYYTLNGEAVYLGYTLDDSDGDGVLDREQYALAASALEDGDSVRVYNTQHSALSYALKLNGQAEVSVSRLQEIFGVPLANTIISNYLDSCGASRLSNGVLTSPGECGGIALVTFLLDNPQLSGISPADFSDDESDTSIRTVRTGDTEHVTGYDLTMKELVDIFQIAQTYLLGRTYPQYKLYTQNGAVGSSAWQSFFETVEAYEQTNRSAIYLAMYDEDSGHAVLVTGVDGWETFEKTITVHVADSNFIMPKTITLTNEGTDSYQITNIESQPYGDELVSMLYFDATQIVSFFRQYFLS